ncbi:MAG: CsbD family protein [Thermoanaerobaculia bacterium]|nr:CsbD family protein [Thermoanaerobaculia bacterium]
MNWDQIESNWKQVKGRFRQKWGKLTGNDLEQAAGIRDRLTGVLQKRYALAKDEAERKLDEFIRSLESPEEEPEGGERSARRPGRRSPTSER